MDSRTDTVAAFQGKLKLYFLQGVAVVIAKTLYKGFLSCHQSIFFRPWHLPCQSGVLGHLGKIPQAPRVPDVYFMHKYISHFTQKTAHDYIMSYQSRQQKGWNVAWVPGLHERIERMALVNCHAVETPLTATFRQRPTLYSFVPAYSLYIQYYFNLSTMATSAQRQHVSTAKILRELKGQLL